MKIYTVIIHDFQGQTIYTGTADELIEERYYSNISNAFYDIVGLKINLNKRELLEELEKLRDTNKY